MDISTTSPALYFKVFYYLAFGLIFIAVLIHAYQKKYPLRTILLLLSTLILFTIIGTRLFTIPVSEWLGAMTGQTSVNTSDRSAIGGLIFGLGALLLIQRLFRLDKSIMILFAWLVPLGMAIQKVGCFFNGCCFGTISDAPWAVQYGVGTNVHYGHWSANIIDDSAMLSNGVHPVQLYETICLTLIAVLLWKTRHWWKKGTSMLFLGLGLIFAFRFGIEFLRDPMSSKFSEIYIFGVRSFQWMLLCLGVLFLLIARGNERVNTSARPGIANSYRGISLEMWYAISLSVVIYCFSKLLANFELWVIWAQYIPALLLVFSNSLNSHPVERHRFLSAMLLLVPVYVVAQTLQVDSIQKKKYKKIELSGAFGDYYNRLLSDPMSTSPGGCGGSSTVYQGTEFLENQFSAFGGGFSQVWEKGNNTLEVGGRAHFGSISTSIISTGEEQTTSIWSIGPYARYDMNWWGFGVGIQAGSMRYYDEDTFIVDNPATDFDSVFETRNINPDIYLRVGPRKWFDIEYHYGFLAPSPLPLLQHRFSAGTRFGGSNFSVRSGQFFPLNQGFVSGEVLIQDRIGIHVMYIFKEEYDFGTFSPSGEIVFGLNYRFDFKED